VNSQGGDAPNFILSGDADRKVYLDLLRHSIELHNLTLVRYFLMFNHDSAKPDAAYKTDTLISANTGMLRLRRLFAPLEGR